MKEDSAPDGLRYPLSVFTIYAIRVRAGGRLGVTT
jgi:hypothetical protein